MADGALQFDAADHRYTLAGTVLPSVTGILSILNDFEGIPAATIENARQRGARLHRAIDLSNRGDLDEASLDDETLGGVRAWQRFIAETGSVVIASEMRVYHPQMFYAGTIDVLIERNGKLEIPDIKGTYMVPRSVGAQTWGYAAAYHAMHGGRGRMPARCCVHIKDGEFSLHPRTDPADEAVFRSCLNIVKWKQQRNAA